MINDYSSAKGITKNDNDRCHMEDYGISLYQERFWIEWKLDPASNAYNTPLLFEIKGELNVDALQYALDTFIHHYDEGCRSFFTQDTTSIRQTVLENVAVNIDITQNESRESFIQRLVNHTFDLTKPPLFHFQLLVLSEQHHILGLTFHHIISDAMTAGFFIQIISDLYNNYLLHKDNQEHKPIKKMADYLVYEREHYPAEQHKHDLAYWKNLLEDSELHLEIPVNDTKPIDKALSKSIYFNLDKMLSQQLKNLAREHSSSLFILLSAIYGVLLLRYSNQSSLVLNYPVNMRPPGFRDKTGCFVNNLLFKIDIASDKSFHQLLDELTAQRKLTKNHQRCSLTDIVQHLREHGILQGQKFFNVDFYEAYLGSKPLTLDGLTISTIQVPQSELLNDIGLAYQNSLDEIEFRLEYKPKLFGDNFADHFIALFKDIIAQVINNVELSVHQCKILTQDESKVITKDWNSTQSASDKTQTVCDLIEKVAEQYPNQIAAKLSDQTITYKELNEKANQVASYLNTLNIGSGNYVGLYVDRSIEMLIGMLGIMKAGAAYVPLDPKYPDHRIQYMIKDAKLSVVLTVDHLWAQFPEKICKLICIDSDWHVISATVINTQKQPISLESAAYVIYTSGSTGTPKGVVISHHALLNHNLFAQSKYELSTNDNVLQLSSINFDISVEEIFPSLISGSTLILYPDADGLSIQVIENLITKENISVCNLPTALWHAWVYGLKNNVTDYLPTLRLIIVGGEQANYHALESWVNVLGNRVRWINTYGPTEGTIISSVWEYSANAFAALPSKQIPIGKPIANCQLYITDSYLNPVPVGTVGDLYISGDNLAIGYLNNPGLTAEKFIRNPFSEIENSRLYQSGDRARYLPDGNIEYIGRKDNQIKLRGYRIELSEIESILLHYPHISNAVVIDTDDGQGEKFLIAYLVKHQDSVCDISEIKKYLATELPSYMVPVDFIILDSLPLTSNGKLDKRALKQLRIHQHKRDTVVILPQSTLEQKIVDIWREILQRDYISIEDNFFDLGGHSLLLLKMQNKLEHVLHITVPVVSLFQYPTIKSLAMHLSAQEDTASAGHKIQTNAQKQRLAMEKQRQLIKTRRSYERVQFK